ncbi:MAG: FecR family protein [Alphaproteobacteria bacterium]
MLRMLLFVMLIFGLLLTGGQAKAERIGVAAVVKNEVNGSAAGNNRVIKVGAGVFQNEVITTGAKSSAQLLFRDETSLTIGASARLTLDRFVYNPNRKTGDVVVNVVQGAFRFVSGSAGPGSYKIKTPVASIGLRGTIVEGYVSPDGSLFLVIVEGSVIVTTADGTTVTLTAGQYITVSSSGAVTGPSPWTGRTLDIESGHEFILDTDNPQGEQRNQLNDALDSRNLDINFPDAGGGRIKAQEPGINSQGLNSFVKGDSR